MLEPFFEIPDQLMRKKRAITNVPAFNQSILIE